MRELKFRAWDLNEKRLILEGDGYCQNVYCHAQANACELMQYTGLKDKNGKEIYEGDIIKVKSFNGMKVLYDIEEIKYENRDFEEYGTCIGFRSYSRGRVEIIGNIYENPELLK